jgi:hypothetical protein
MQFHQRRMIANCAFTRGDAGGASGRVLPVHPEPIVLTNTKEGPFRHSSSAGGRGCQRWRRGSESIVLPPPAGESKAYRRRYARVGSHVQRPNSVVGAGGIEPPTSAL